MPYPAGHNPDVPDDAAADAKQKVNEAVAAANDFKGEQKEVDFEGYKFIVDTGLVDDVEIIDLIDAIETRGHLKSIVELLHYLIGADGYEKMKAHFVEKEGRFKLTKLTKVYEAIFAVFDPKG